MVYILDVATATGAAYYYTDADFDSSTRVLSAPLSALGLSRGSTFDFYVLAYDNYFSGVITDAIGGRAGPSGRRSMPSPAAPTSWSCRRGARLRSR